MLYKYVSADTAALILGNKTLKFTNPKDFNDPLDCYEGLIDYVYKEEELKRKVKRGLSGRLSGTRKERRAIFHNLTSKPSAMLKMQREILLEEREKIGVCCFSGKYDNILMWSHYAAKHSGACLGFRLPPVVEGFWAIYPVRYSSEITKISPKESLIDVMRHWLLTKAAEWEYEKEYRAICPNFQGYAGFDSGQLQEIYFGCKIKPVARKELIKSLREDFGHVRRYQMQINEHLFRLRPNKLA